MLAVLQHQIVDLVHLVFGFRRSLEFVVWRLSDGLIHAKYPNYLKILPNILGYIDRLVCLSSSLLARLLYALLRDYFHLRLRWLPLVGVFSEIFQYFILGCTLLSYTGIYIYLFFFTSSTPAKFRDIQWHSFHQMSNTWYRFFFLINLLLVFISSTPVLRWLAEPYFLG